METIYTELQNINTSLTVIAVVLILMLLFKNMHGKGA